MSAADLSKCITTDFQTVVNFLEALKQEVEAEGTGKIEAGICDVPDENASGVKILCRTVILAYGDFPTLVICYLGDGTASWENRNSKYWEDVSWEKMSHMLMYHFYKLRRKKEQDVAIQTGTGDKLAFSRLEAMEQAYKNLCRKLGRAMLDANNGLNNTH